MAHSPLSAILLKAARMSEGLRDHLLHAAAGALKVNDLRLAVASSWRDFNNTKTDIESGLMKWEQAFADRFLHPGCRVALVGCGSGRDLIALARLRCQVTGIEPAAEAAAGARRAIRAHECEATVVEGFFEDLSIQSTFDAVIFSNYCVSYIPGRQRRVDVLRKAREALAPKGVVIASILFRQHPPFGRSHRTGRLAGALTRSDWRIEPGDAFDTGRKSNDGIMYEHFFGPGELEQDAEAAGLRLVCRPDDLHLEPYLVFRAP